MRPAVPLTALLFLSLAPACVVSSSDDGATTDQSEHDVVGTPDELALLRFLNDASTTVTVLDDQVPLDKRAATNLIAHRNGADGALGTADDDLFDSSAEVDAVPYVGPSALARLVAYADAGGWVKDGELFGTFDGVPFTVAETRATIALVNGATDATLDGAVKLDARAARSIVAARPIATMATLAGLYYVGGSALTKLKAYAEPPPACTDDALVAQLTTTTNGMLLLSESDRPLTPVSWPGQAVAGESPAAFLALLGDDPSTSIVVGSFDEMITRFGYESDPAKVAALQALFQDNLTGIAVYEVGLIQVSDYVVGMSKCGGLVGVVAISIET